MPPPLLVQGLLIGSLGSSLLGYSISVLNTALPALAGDFEWCGSGSLLVACDDATVAHGALSSALITGAAAGCLMSGSLMKYFGRRASLAAIFWGFLLTSIAAAVVQDDYAFRVIRIVTGLFVGIATVVPAVYLQELAPSRLANLAGLLPAIAASIGILVGVIMGFPLAQPDADMRVTASQFEWNAYWWRRMVAAPAAVCIISLSFLYTTLRFEPPNHLRSIGKPALDIEARLWGTEGHESLDVATRRRSETEEEYNARTSTVTTTASVITELSSRSECGLPTLKDSESRLSSRMTVMTMEPLDVRDRSTSLIQKVRRHWPLLVLGWVVAAGQQLSGMNAILASSNVIFLRAGLPSEALSALSAMMAALQLVACLVTGKVVGKVSPPALLAGGAALMGVALLLLPIGAFFPNAVAAPAAVAAVLLFATMYGLTYGPGLLFYLFELFPVEIRDVGLSIAFALCWVASVGAVQTASILTVEATFTIFACVCFFISFLVGMPLVRALRKKSKLVSAAGATDVAHRRMEMANAATVCSANM